MVKLTKVFKVQVAERYLTGRDGYRGGRKVPNFLPGDDLELAIDV